MKVARKPRKFVCPCGRHKIMEPHIGFCEDHQLLLDEAREGLAQHSGQHVRLDQGRKKRPSTCCRVGCQEPRPRSEKYCLECRELGLD